MCLESHLIRFMLRKEHALVNLGLLFCQCYENQFIGKLTARSMTMKFLSSLTELLIILSSTYRSIINIKYMTLIITIMVEHTNTIFIHLQLVTRSYPYMYVIMLQ